ncbi:MAG: SpaH/EbpB family LPXTG-anchored major pilin [Oscillospiraceae bacterium]|nr:SpaH/EbpB family LPXTG-anchored major pilin [Oscillospiraceae bacterium]
MKKLISLILALMLVFTLAASAFATETTPTTGTTTPTTGSIIINNVSAQTVYSVYKLLDLESYNVTSGAYAYKVNSAWTGFFATSDALNYVVIDTSGYVTWKTGGDPTEEAVVFAKLALKYAQNHGISPVRSSTNGDLEISTNEETGITSGVFNGLDLGYYLVDSSAGALCGLTTTNPNAVVNVKNGTPTLDKQVMEDSTSQWGDSNTADIGQVITFRTTINVHPGPENYVLHDQFSAGLTFKEIVKIEHVVPSSVTNEVPAEYYTVRTQGTETKSCCTFEIHFTDEFCEHLETNDKIIVTYTAMLNRNAVIAGDGNENETWLHYGHDHFTTHDKTTTLTYGIDIIKTDSQNALLDGAEFKIYDALEGGNEVAVVLMDDGVTYRRARADEKGIAIKVTGGKVRVVGLDNGTYYLEETVAPAGHNKLAARHRFIIADSNLDAIFTDGAYSVNSGVQIVNKSGTMLPETGAMGTAMFLFFGATVVLACSVLLITKKRMSMIQD